MRDHKESHDEVVIDLGQASVETKGDGISQLDASGGKLVFMPGLVDN